MTTRYGQPEQPEQPNQQPEHPGGQPPQPAPPGAEYLGTTTLLAEPSGVSRGRRRTAWIAGAAAAALLVGAATASALVVGRLSGGGAHPADRLPATAMAYVEVDLDPSAGQKVGAVRFLRKFPQLRGKFAEDRDLRRSLWDVLVSDEKDLAKLDYSRDIKPWLGSRVGFAVLPPAAGAQLDDKSVVAAVQVRDEAKARDGLHKLNQADPSDEDAAFAFLDGYAILATDQATADRAVAAARQGSLAGNDRFAGDLDNLGERGVSSGWVDLEALAGTALATSPRLRTDPDAERLLREQAKGRLAYGVRFDGDDLEVVAKGRALPHTEAMQGAATVRAITHLPASTGVAVGLANGDAYVRSAWQRVERSLAGVGGSRVQQSIRAFEQQTGLRVPDDLGTLLGRDFALALEPAGQAPPKVGVRAVTDGARAEDVLTKILAAAGRRGGGGAVPPVTVRRTADGYVAASTAQHADALAGGGDLGEQGAFKAALPQLDAAVFAAYLDFDRVVAQLRPDGAADTREAVAAIDAVGLTVQAGGDGTAELRLKVVTR